jgi:hypothetical protein
MYVSATKFRKKMEPAPKFLCMYTKQKTQKRKRFEEGEVRLSPATRFVAVHPKHEGSGRVVAEPLDGAYLDAAEFAALVAGTETTFETEKLLVNIECEGRAPALDPRSSV